MIELRRRTLRNGMPLVLLAMPGTRALTLLVTLDAGARTERREENGMAHFLEHLVFKGGERFPSHRAVNETAERLGAQLNAYTSHDLVAFHASCRAEAAMEAADLVTDFVARARLDAADIDRERGVVIQEIARSDDQPASVASKLLDRAVFGDHPLGRPVLGPAEHLRSFTRDDLLAFRERRWSPAAGAAILAGDLSHLDEPRLEQLLGRFAADPEPEPPDPAPGFERRVLVEPRETNQSHLRLQWPAPVEPLDIRRRAALTVYATLLGGSMGSRLFTEIREQRGLCYAIRAAGWVHADASSLEVASGLESGKCGEAYARIREIVDELAAEGPAPGEVERARSYAAGTMVLSLEGTNAVARRAAHQLVTFGEEPDPEAAVEALDAVSEDEVRAVAREIAGPPTVACVGPHEAEEFE